MAIRACHQEEACLAQPQPLPASAAHLASHRSHACKVHIRTKCAGCARSSVSHARAKTATEHTRLTFQG
eukprot:9470455-Pyramimonas_sp.AAC.1